jgi:hypothetical protein
MDRLEPAAASSRCANRHGAEAKGQIEAIVERSGYCVQRRVPIGENIFGHQHRVDFVVEGRGDWPDGLIVEVRSQETIGTAEQKLVFLADNICHRYPMPTVVVLLGGGVSDGAVEWPKDQVDGRHLIAVTTLSELTRRWGDYRWVMMRFCAGPDTRWSMPVWRG